jgi:hypothetical protein
MRATPPQNIGRSAPCARPRNARHPRTITQTGHDTHHYPAQVACEENFSQRTRFLTPVAGFARQAVDLPIPGHRSQLVGT